MPLAIGIDLGGTNVKTVCMSAGGNIVQQHAFATDDSPAGDAKWSDRIRQIVEQIQLESDDIVEWIGLASPGLARRDETAIAWMVGRLDQVMNLSWTDVLRWHRQVPVINDAHAALLGEVNQGAAVGATHAVLLTLGTGVGGAILADGKLLKGHIGRAGHIGHMTVNADGPPDIVQTPGSLEDAIGDCTIKQRSNGRFESTRELVIVHKAGDADATRIWLDSVRSLAAGIVSIVNAVDPEFVIVGGGIAQAGPALFEPLQQFVDKYEWRPLGDNVKIVPATLGEFAGAIGAAYNAMNKDRK